MRPRGEIRQAISDAAYTLKEQGGGTFRDLAQLACVGYQAAEATAKNMARAGELAVVGKVRVPNVRRPMNKYAPAEQGENWITGATSLSRVMQGWNR
jgi:hypothetical protein